jgi:hypothetical protein
VAQLRDPIRVGKERRRPLPGYFVPLVVAIVVVIAAVVIVLVGVGGRNAHSKRNTGDIGRVGNTSRQNQLPGRAPAGGVSHTNGGTTP